MASSVSKDVLVAAPPERLFALIADFARYPEFVPGVKKAAPKAAGPGAPVDVEYEIDLGVKTIRYVLRHLLVPPRRVEWHLVSGEWMKVSNGSWELTPEGEGTRARYSVEVQIAKPALVPQSIVDKVTDELTRVQLPRLLAAFKARAEKSA